MKVWERPEGYLKDFYARAGKDWHHSAWDFRNPIAAGPDKVHLDVQFTRYRVDNSAIGSYRSLWIVAKVAGRWAAQVRSSFARKEYAQASVQISAHPEYFLQSYWRRTAQPDRIETER